MAYTTNISPGAPPLLWSSIDQAFRQINQNFTELQLYLSDSTITPIDLTNLYTDLSPGDSAQFSIGSLDKKWRNIFTSSFSSDPGSELNGVWIGSAHIKGTGLTINLPENSTVGGDPETGIGTNLIIDPDKTFFKTIRVDSTDDVIAPGFNSVLNLQSGTDIGISADTGTQTVTINNLGVTSLTASTGISVSTPKGDITIANSGVTSLAPTTTLPVGLAAGSGISVDSTVGDITITNTGIISVAPGFGISVSIEASTGIATISNSAPAQVAFRDFVIDGDTSDPIQADSLSDSFLLNAGYGIILTKNTSIDQLTIEWDQRSDLRGSVFAEDSSTMVDNIDQKIYAAGGFTGNLLGDVKGSVFGDDSTLIVDAVNNTLNTNTITSPGILDILPGSSLSISAQNGPISLSSDGDSVSMTGSSGAGTIAYDDSDGSIALITTGPTTIQGSAGSAIDIGGGTSGNVTIGNGSNQLIVNGTLITSIVDSADSSAINIVPSVNCNSDLTVGGDILPNIDLGGNLGSPSQQWNSLYVSGSTIFIGGVPVTVVNGQLSVNGSTLIGGVAWDDVTNKPEIPDIGDISFIGTTIDSDDSSSIAFVPAVLFNSDLTVENNLFVDNDTTVLGTLTVSSLNVTGTITSQGSGTPELFSDNEILLTAGTRVEVLSSPLKLASYTTSERNTLSPISGDIIYNSSDNNFQGYTGSSWQTLASPVLATVATTGSYTDLSNTPSIPADVSDLTDTTNLLFDGDYNSLSNTPSIPADVSDLTDTTNLLFDGDYNSLSNAPTVPDIGSVTFSGTVIDSNDSSGITFTPSVIFNSDVTVDNELTVGNSVTATDFIGNITATSIITSALTVNEVKETVISKSGATGTVVHDLSAGSVFYHTSISANFTANFTNLDLASGQGTNISLILIQGGTAYISNAVQIGGVAQTINWQDSSPPTGNTDKLDIVTFSIVRIGDTYTVFGALTTFGT